MAPGGGLASTLLIGPEPDAVYSDDGLPLGFQAMPYVDGRLIQSPEPTGNRLFSHFGTVNRGAASSARCLLNGATDAEILAALPLFQQVIGAAQQPQAAVAQQLEVAVAEEPQAVAVAEEPATRYTSRWQWQP